ncbi:MAG: hypothetical protein K0Q43_3684 [Ramlibacter sp.]|jgi:hypothetical protein|nr:hypothetical protein [Ramlibacter sp.]
MDRAGRNPRLSSPGPAHRTGKLPELKDAHEARLTAHAALGQALLKIHSGNAAAAGKTAESLLRRVRAPEFDLTGLSPAEANCVKRMPAEAWMALQRYAQASNEVGITSVALSSLFDIDTRLMDGLAQLHVQHVALGRPVSGTLMARLQTLPFLEHLSQRGPAQGQPEYAALLQERVAQSPETPSLRGANQPPRTVRKMNGKPGLRRSVAPDDRKLQTGLNDAMKSGNGREARFFVGAILRAQLGPRLRLELLMAQAAPEEAKPAALPPRKLVGCLPPRKIFVPQLSAFVEDLAHEQQPAEAQVASPLLGRMCAGFGPASQTGPPSPQDEAVGDYLDEILNSDMPAQDKGTVCASTVSTPQGPRTAAQLAMQDGHPLAAARMILAILECHRGADEKLELLAMLGVSRVEVDTALSALELQKMPWVSEMNRLWKAGWDALALMAGDARVTLKDTAAAKPAVLHAERMWTKGSGKVLCVADREIPQLRFQRVDEQTFEAAGRFCYALDPDWLVKHTAGIPVA